jgi:adenylate cyclase
VADEIERKFLLNRDYREVIREEARRQQWMSCQNIQQVYMPKTGKWAIRGRRTQIGAYGEPGSDTLTPQFCITMKRRKTKLTATEIETAVAGSAYDEMVAAAGHAPINKNRFYYYIKGKRALSFCYMIDVFLNPELGGLVLAEIELESEDEVFPRPDWLGEEVTGIKGYSNASMAEKLVLV